MLWSFVSKTGAICAYLAWRGVYWLRAVVLFLGSAASIAAIATESDLVRARWSQYVAACAVADYVAAARVIHPDDLAGIQAHILPLFVRGLRADNADVRNFANAFFAGVPDANRTILSGAETFVQFMKFIALVRPELTTAMRESRFEISAVSFDGESPPNATVKYKMVKSDISFSDFDQLSKLGDDWYVRTREAPEATAAKFRTVLQK